MLLGIGVGIRASTVSFGGHHASPAKPSPDKCDDKCKPDKPHGVGGSISFGVMPLGAVLFGGIGKLF